MLIDNRYFYHITAIYYIIVYYKKPTYDKFNKIPICYKKTFQLSIKFYNTMYKFKLF